MLKYTAINTCETRLQPTDTIYLKDSDSLRLQMIFLSIHLNIAQTRKDIQE